MAIGKYLSRVYGHFKVDRLCISLSISKRCKICPNTSSLFKTKKNNEEKNISVRNYMYL